MAFTWNDLRSDVLGYLRERGVIGASGSQVPSDILDGAIIKACQKITRKTRIPTNYIQQTFLTTVAELIIPQDIYQILEVYVNGQELYPTQYEVQAKEDRLTPSSDWTILSADTVPTQVSPGKAPPVSSLNGIIFKYYLDGNRLGFVPNLLANAAVILRVVQYIQIPGNGDNTLPYTDGFREWIVLLAFKKLLRRAGQDDRADRLGGDILEEELDSKKEVSQASHLNRRTLKPLPYRTQFRAHRSF